MNQVKSILKDLSEGEPIKKTARIHKVSKNTVKKYLTIFKTSGLVFSQLEEISDDTFHHLFYIQPLKNDIILERSADLKQRLPWIVNELGRTGVTRELIYKQYISDYPTGYSYSRFCRKLKELRAVSDATLRIDHKAGYRMMVDFAGRKAHWVDARTGEVHHCEVLVCTLPYSSFTHVYAVPSQKQSDFVIAINEALKYIGGTPSVLTSDNLKSYVSKASRYEPKFTDFCSQMGSYYTMELDATRVGKPKDKANVERHVSIVYNQIYAPLRDDIFHSLDELNAAFRRQLDELNNKKMQGKPYSRKERFERDEKPSLRPLPPSMFEVTKETLAKVQRNYHVILGENSHQYSVPYQYIGKQTHIIYTNQKVEIYCGTERIAIHKRDHRAHAYSTMDAHMPEKHVQYKEQKGWDAVYFKNKAAQIGHHTLWAMQTILDSKHIVEQTYRGCVGVLRLSDTYGAQRLENAAQRAATGHRVNYGILLNILQNNMDKIEIELQTENQNISKHKIPTHDNLRGAVYYAQTTLHL
ncbi:MAG TPA: IS21 family transposase [Saprospiraceae bacterium]|nr:IS21 family transposase [Saprospiraceae bacterium]